jgi:hypothetical protein
LVSTLCLHLSFLFFWVLHFLFLFLLYLAVVYLGTLLIFLVSSLWNRQLMFLPLSSIWIISFSLLTYYDLFFQFLEVFIPRLLLFISSLSSGSLIVWISFSRGYVCILSILSSLQSLFLSVSFSLFPISIFPICYENMSLDFQLPGIKLVYDK